jgi:hypothetical protein
VSQTLNWCESARRAVSVTVTTTVAISAPTAYAQSFCSAATVANLVAYGTSLKWYATATGGVALASTTALIMGNYYVSQTINSVESSRTMVAVTIYGAPIVKEISTTTSNGSKNSPICITAAKVLNLGAGYSATNIQWERAVIGLNSNNIPASSAYAAIDGATGPSYTVSNALPGRNFFRVRFTNGNCSNTTLYSNPITIFYKDCSATARLTVVSYPNPFTDTFNLKVTAPTEDKIDLSVYDMMGRLMEHTQVNLIDVSELKLGDRYPSGIYNVVIAQGEEVKTIRVVKE